VLSPNNYGDIVHEKVWRCPFCQCENWFNKKSELLKHCVSEKHNEIKNWRRDIDKCYVWVVKENGKWRTIK
jgi:hypothetical protein